MKKRETFRKKVIVQHVLKLKQGFDANLPVRHRKNKKDYIHDIRVIMKRYKALLAMINSIHRNINPIKFPKKLKTFYKSSGVIRDLEVQQNLMKKHDLPFDRVFLKTKEKSTTRKFVKKYNSTSERKQLIKAVNKLNEEIIQHDISNKAAKKYINTLLFEISSLLDKTGKQRLLHEARKKTKELMFNLRILKKINPELNLDKSLDLRLNLLQEILGQWHDLAVASEWAEKMGFENRSVEKLNKKKAEKELEIDSAETLLNAVVSKL